MPHSPDFHPVVIAPTYNNVRTLRGVLDRIALQQVPIMVVNDGSSDDTAAILAKWHADTGGQVVTHPVNKGKAEALRTGFREAAGRGYTHAVTIDTDGQLDPNQIADLLVAAREHHSLLIVGDRDETAPDYPKKSRTGRRVSNFWVRFESGLKISDSQCGFRVYPLDVVNALPCKSGRYGFETEVLTRAAWAGVGVHHVPVACKYDVPEGRVSHLKPGRDTLRHSAMHLRLIGRAIVPWDNVARFDHPDHPRETGTIWRRLKQWVSPIRAWRQVRDEPEGRRNFAVALALGVFIANLPIYSFQTILAIYLSRRFKLHPLPVVMGSHLSTPPISAALIFAAIAVGHWLLYRQWPDFQHFNPSVVGYVGALKSLIGEWILGSVIVGSILAVVTYIVTRVCLHFASPRNA